MNEITSLSESKKLEKDSERVLNDLHTKLGEWEALEIDQRVIVFELLLFSVGFSYQNCANEEIAFNLIDKVITIIDPRSFH
tara:strand:- start:521 stop:763 length:243 start_codon:yes stop_codon:yes gene_type:complete